MIGHFSLSLVDERDFTEKNRKQFSLKKKSSSTESLGTAVRAKLLQPLEQQMVASLNRAEEECSLGQQGKQKRRPKKTLL